MEKFFVTHVPGHARAYTWRIALVASAVFYYETRHWQTALLGGIVLALGEFLGNQATHLAQENHTGIRVSWIEKRQQRRTSFFQWLGLVVFALGLWIGMMK